MLLSTSSWFTQRRKNWKYYQWFPCLCPQVQNGQQWKWRVLPWLLNLHHGKAVKECYPWCPCQRVESNHGLPPINHGLPLIRHGEVKERYQWLPCQWVESNHGKVHHRLPHQLHGLVHHPLPRLLEVEVWPVWICQVESNNGVPRLHGRVPISNGVTVRVASPYALKATHWMLITYVKCPGPKPHPML